MKRLVLTIVALGILGAAAWYALSSDPPTALAARARVALEELQARPEAAQWAPVEYVMAVESVEAAQSELEVQMRRLPVMRDFRRAETLFEQALVDVSLARRASSDGVESARREATQVLEAAVAGLGHARTTLLIAPLEGNAPAASRQIESRLAAAEEEIVRLRRLVEEGRYQEALDAGEALLEELSDLVGRVRLNGRN